MSDMHTLLSIDEPVTSWQRGDDSEEDTTLLLSDLKDMATEAFGDVDVSAWPDGSISIAGWSKYQRDELHDFAADYTAATKSTVTITEEWGGEGGPSVETYVWRGGERVHPEEQVSQLVPANLAELIAAVRAAADALNATADGDSNDAEIEAGQEMRDVALALADALS